MKRIGKVAVTTLGLGFSFVGVPAWASTAKAVSPTTLMRSIVNAGDAENSVHYVVSSAGGTTRLVMVGDVARTEGIQRITFANGSGQGEVSVVVLDHTAYVRGTAFALRNYMGFTATQSAKYSNVWIRIPDTYSGYSTLAAGVTLESAIGELSIPGPLSRMANEVLSGQDVLTLRAHPVADGKHFTATLYARSEGSPLPVEESAVATGASSKTSFSNWNEAVSEVPPLEAVAISTVLSS
jgi:hypothetical protein